MPTFDGEPRNLIFHDLRWEPRAELCALSISWKATAISCDGYCPLYWCLWTAAIKLVEPGENEFLAEPGSQVQTAEPFLPRDGATAPKC